MSVDLPAPGGAAEADDGGPPGRRINRPGNRVGERASLFDERQASRKRGRLATPQTVEQRRESGVAFKRR